MWMFVYPREAVLVRRYIACLDAMAGKEEKKVLVWAGPKSDWEDVFEGEFGVEGIVRRGLYAGVEGGVADWEVLVVSDWVG